MTVIADASSKVTVFFEASGGTAPTGWTETFYSSQSDLSTLLALVVSKYVPKRKDLLGVGASIQSVRVTNVPPSRISQVAFLAGKDGQGGIFTNSPADDYDPTQVDLLCRLSDAAGKRRSLFLSGLPDSQTDSLLQSGVIGTFSNAPVFKAWVNAITSIPLNIRYKTSNGPPPVFSSTPIANVQPIMVRNRKRGRPFELFRGRRLA